MVLVWRRAGKAGCLEGGGWPALEFYLNIDYPLKKNLNIFDGLSFLSNV